MKKIINCLTWGLMGFALFFCQSCYDSTIEYVVTSPDGKIKVEFFLSEPGRAGYKALFKDQVIIDTSMMSFDLSNGTSLGGGLAVNEFHCDEVNDSWEMPWGEQKTVENKYNQLIIELAEQYKPHRKFNVIFRVYDDGIGFRYEFPEQEGWADAVIMDENTQFQLTGDHTTWWIPGDWDIYEHLYNTTKVSEIDAIAKRNHPNLAQTYIPENAVNTPVTMKTADGLYLSFHEANLTNYSGMTLKVDPNTLTLQSELVGSPDSSKVKRKLPFKTPWRTIQIAEKPGDLIDSKLIVNLNEPNKLDDVSWIKPTKYVGIWWEMHLDKSTWDKASGRHGATTENAKRYIDFASERGINGLLVEGWNTGWEVWLDQEKKIGAFDFVTPYDDYDLEEVVRYGKEKGVGLIMHHETSAVASTYDQQLDTAFALCQNLGIHAIKTGYVGKIIPQGEFHHGQWMVNHYRRVLEKAAEYQIMVNAHEPIKATGIRRTYPNMIAREGLRGQEFNAWSVELNPPEHLTIVPFTRMLAGPIDFTPGIFDIKMAKYNKGHVNTTLAQQLALYVIIYSPIQMAADLPENYEGNPAFQFITDVALDWDESMVLDAEIGDYISIARKAKDSDKWFMGAITDENPRDLNTKLDFLKLDQDFVATMYMDAEDAHYDTNPTALEIKKFIVNKDTELKLKLVAGGGAAIMFEPVDEGNIKGVELYP